MTLKERYKGILGWFGENMPVVGTELDYMTPYQLLVATILAAQCTDKRVNMTTPALFERFPSPQVMAEAAPEDIYPYIKSISYPNNKAKNLAAMARRLVSDYGGVIPDDVEEMQKLPGVGRKTANVVGAVIFDKHVMPVDTHVFRVARRLGLTSNAKTPLETEKQLTANIPGPLLPKAHHWLILHGRYVCTARNPKCHQCGLTPWCKNPVAKD
jgi:endonuclease-3